ncbi:hypothetical protein [Synechococcus sp. CC9616]|nr:hypothetical protein [Synechococcus sp. CC9616]
MHSCNTRGAEGFDADGLDGNGGVSHVSDLGAQHVAEHKWILMRPA